MSRFPSSRINGFTLVEVMVYLFILLVVSTASIGLLLSLDDFIQQYQVETALYRSGTNVLEPIMVAIREGDDYDSVNSIVNDPLTGKLVVHNGGVATEFAIVAGAIELTVDGDNKGNLLSDGVVAQGFTVYSYTTGVGTYVRVKLDLEATVGGVVKSITLYDGAVIRGEL